MIIRIVMIPYHQNTNHWLMTTTQFGFHVPQVSKINLVDELSLRSEIVECVEQCLMK